MRLNPDKIKVSDKLDQTVQDALSQVKQEARRARRKKLFITCGSMAAAFAAAPSSVLPIRLSPQSSRSSEVFFPIWKTILLIPAIIPATLPS